MKRIYRENAERTGVAWKRRDFDAADFEASDGINMALSAAHTCLYGLTHAVITAIGASPGLGFVHNGHERAFVYDIADLYKAEITIPLAFDVAAEQHPNVGSAVRLRARDAINTGNVISRMVSDITRLFFDPDDASAALDSLGRDDNVVSLWDPRGVVAGGANYDEDN